MKKTTSIVLALILLLSGTVSAFGLTDTTGTVYETAVDALVEKGYVSGYPDETFRPEKTLSRAEATSIIVSFTGATADDMKAAPAAAFSDMDTHKWAQPAVNYAVANGILSGYTDGTFRPGNEVSYAELAVMVVNAMGLKDKVTGAWDTGYMNVASEEGYLEGAVSFDIASDLKFAATRGNTAIIVYNAELKKAPVEETPEEPKEEIVFPLSDFSGYAYGAINGYSSVLNEDDEDVYEIEFVFGDSVQYLLTKDTFTPDELAYDGTLYCLQMKDGVVAKVGTKDTVAAQNMKVKKFLELTNGYELVTDRESNRVVFTEETGYIGLNDDLLSIYVATIDGEDASIDDIDEVNGYRPGTYKDVREDDMIRVYDVTYDKNDDGYGDVVFVVKE